MNNEAQIQVQFNWIFVIIVGAVILAFFFSIIFSMGKTSETKVDISLANQFNTIITTTNQKIGTVKQYSVPKVDLNFECLENEGVYYFALGDLKARDTKYDLFFSPRTLNDKYLYTWTQEWKAPYGIGTFLYLTNSQNMYAFISNSTNNYQFEELTENFPNNLTSRFIYRNETNHFQNTFDKGINLDSYTYIFLKDDLPKPNELNNPLNVVDDSVIIIIDPAQADVFAYGNITYLSKNNYETYYDDVQNDDSYPHDHLSVASYLGKASLYAAIFSGDASRYRCGMDKALVRFKAINLLQIYKIENVLPRVNTYCYELLNGSDDEFILGARSVLNDINTTLQSNFKTLNVHELYDLDKKLDDYNSKIAIEANCPLVY